MNKYCNKFKGDDRIGPIIAKFHDISCLREMLSEFISESVKSNIDVINNKVTTNKFGHLCTTTNIMEFGNDRTNSIITLEFISIFVYS